MRTSSTLSPILTTPAIDRVITVDGLVKSYGGRRVVDGVDLEVRRGEIFGIFGANGAGKTTTVECMQGLRRADAGTVRVLGHDPVAEHSVVRTTIGSQLQESALPERLRVGEAIALFDRSGRLDPTDHLGAWGLSDQIATAFGDLSGGQRQRLFIVLALLDDPQVVFLDELTQGLDPTARRDVWTAVERVRDRGTTVVLVSHFAEKVERLCDRVAVIRDGRIVDVATPQDLIDRHATATTITCTPHNIGTIRPIATIAQRLLALPHVRQVDRVDGRVVISGTGAMVAPVCAALLDEHGGGPSDLRVTHPTLDDALVALIGVDR